MDSHKTTVLALSLSVLTLAVVSTFLSLSQSRVLGESTSGGTPIPIKPTSAPASGVCRELRGLYDAYCLNSGDDSGDNNNLPEPENDNPMCQDIYKVLDQACPSGTPGPRPTSACKYGPEKFTFGTECPKPTLKPGSSTNLMYTESSYVSASYVCPDGKEGVVKPAKGASCSPANVLRLLARQACEGHGTCKRPSGTPAANKRCTGNGDCEKGEVCVITPRPSVVPTGVQTAFPSVGRCVKSGTTVTPSVTTSPSGTATPTKKAELSCTWCGTNCVVSRLGLKCPLMSAPAGKDCIAVGKACKIVDLED